MITSNTRIAFNQLVSIGNLIACSAAKLGLLGCLMISFLNANAQNKLRIGIKVSPSIIFSRVADLTKRDLSYTQNGSPTTADIKYESGPASFSINSGIIFDYFFAENYAISTQLLYAVKRAAVNSPTFGRVTYNNQGIQIPVLIKLYTNEIATDMRLYFNLGPSFDFKFSQKLKSYEPNDVALNNIQLYEVNGSRRLPEPEGTPFRLLDISSWSGAGIEYKVGEQTTLFGGISYNRGFVNQISNEGAFQEQNKLTNGDFKGQPGASSNRYRLNSDIISFDIGVKF
jgi:hypothetical protein